MIATKLAINVAPQPSQTTAFDIDTKLQELLYALQQQDTNRQVVQYCINQLERLSPASQQGIGVPVMQQHSGNSDQFAFLLQQVMKHPSDSILQKILGKKKVGRRLMMSAFGVLMIAIGFTMIVLPAPHDFEMFTIFYFNPNDGFTLMDLFSLLIVFGGVFILLNAIRKR